MEHPGKLIRNLGCGICNLFLFCLERRCADRHRYFAGNCHRPEWRCGFRSRCFD
jgi:hypothetical protein